MSGRKHIGKKTRSQLNSTSVPNPLQRRRLKAPPQIQSGLSQQQDAPSIPEQLQHVSQFNHNFLDVPVEAPATAPPSPSIQGKVDVGGVGNQQQGEIAIADTVESQDEEFKAEEQTVEQEQISAGEGTENQEAPDSNTDQTISDSEKESEIVQRQPEHSSLQGQLEKASRFNHNFLDVPVNGVGSSQLPIQRQVNFSNLEENSYPQEEVSPVDPVKNSLNLFKTQTIQSKESIEAEELEQKSPTETPPIENEEVGAVDPVKNSLNLFKTQTIQSKESIEAEELEQKSPTETPPIENEEVGAVDPVKNSWNLFKTQTIQRKESIEGEELEQKSPTERDPIQKKEVSAVDPVKNSLDLFKTQTIQRKESIEGEELEQKSPTERDPIQTKGIEEQPSLERKMIGAPSEEETIGQEKELEAQQPKKLTSQPLEFTSNKEQPILADNAPQEEPIKNKTLAETSAKETFNKEHQLPTLEGQESKPNEAKKLAENSSEIPSNKEQPKLSAEEGETEPLKAKKLEPNPPQAESSAKTTQTNLNVKTVAGQTPTVPASQAKPEVGTQKGIAQTAAPGATPATQETASAGSAPAIASGGGSAEVGSEGAGGETEDDAELAEVAAANQPVELESSERDAAMASLAEGAGGGEVPAGGGGGGAAIADKPTPPVPEVSQSDPSAALAAVSNLPPAQLQAALGGVSAAVGNTVGKERAELAANPPEMASPVDATKTESAADKSLPDGKTPKAVEKAPEGQAQPVPPPPPLPLPAKPPVANVPSPQVAGNAEGKLDSGDAQKLQASLRNLPTRDPSLEQVSAGSPPPLELAGDADPKQAQEQRTKLEKGVADAHTQGQQDLAQPMGENEIYPKVPQETLRAEGIGGGGAAGGGAAAKGAGGEGLGGAAGDDAVSIIAQQEKGSEIQAAVAKAQAEIAAKRQEHTTQVAQEKTRSNQEITRLQQENTTQQAQERAKAQGEVTKLRSDWQKEQDSLVQKSRTEADEAVSKGNQDVAKEQTEAEKQATEHIKKGDEDAAVARRQGEEEAEKERQKGEQESGGILGWLADKAKAFFDGIKQAIQKAFEVARAAVKAAIEGAQKLATAVIEAGRKAIVGIIKVVGDVLIAIGDKLLAAFPELRDRFRNAIKSAVKAAEDAVNALANTLKKGVQAALNLLAKGLDAALGLLEKGMMAAVDLANQAVQGAIKFADAAIKAMAAFAVLVKDISGNPGQWLSNLGAGANDGIRNHFWGAFQTAVQEWFSQKVEEVLGLGMTVWNVLKQGGINTAEVGKMAWEGIKSAIPAVLIGILIEKVVSMIVPAAGTVIVIIEGLQAAWGTVSRILQAFERFMAFLKAVKTGQAGPPFGAALASAGVVVIDFVANWLLKRLRGPASKVAGKIKEIAKKIGNKVKKALKKVKQKLGKVKDKFFGKKGNKGRKNKKKDQNQDKALRPIAQRSAQQGWKKVQGLTRKQVQPESAINAELAQTSARKSGVTIKTTVVTRRSTWMVESVATKDGKTAKATAGQGWVTKDAGGKKYYAGINNSSLHKQILQETETKLNQPKTGGTEGTDNLQSSYQQKVQLAKQLEQEGQQKIDNRIKGIKFSVNLEAFEGVKSDKKISTRMTISPNVEELKTNIALQDADSNFNELAQAIQGSTGLKKTYKVVDEIDRLVDGIVKRVNAKQPDPDKKIVATLQAVNDTVVGGVSHKFMFKHQKPTGKPAFLEVQRLSGNTDCASCEINPGKSSPHNVATAAHAKQAIDDALASLGLDDPTSKATRLYLHMRGIAESTGSSAPLPTQGEYQKQCEVCEGSVAGDTDGKYLAAQSVIQRGAGVTAPGGATAASRGMDKQFQSTTPTGRKDITYKRINKFISRLARDIALPVHSSTAPIGILQSNSAQLRAFLTLVQQLLRSQVK